MKVGKFLKEAKKPDYWQKREGSEYMIRETRPNEYEVSKWSRGDTPTELYTVYQRSKTNWTCGCPVKGQCKHIKLVKDWIKKGKKPFMDISDLPDLVKKYIK